MWRTRYFSKVDIPSSPVYLLPNKFFSAPSLPEKINPANRILNPAHPGIPRSERTLAC
jgi:hypothetical protein